MHRNRAVGMDRVQMKYRGCTLEDSDNRGRHIGVAADDMDEDEAVVHHEVLDCRMLHSKKGVLKKAPHEEAH